MAATKILLSREQVDLLTRVSTITRLTPRSYLMRIDVLRLLIEELLTADLEPERITSMGALGAAIEAHLFAALSLADRPVASLAACLRNRAERESLHPGLALARRPDSTARSADRSASHQSLSARLLTNDLVAIDTFRCDVRERAGFNVSRSALIRVLVDSFIRVTGLTKPTIRSRTVPHSASEAVPAVQ